MGMKPYNKQEYNRLCAEFLGWEQGEDGRYWKKTPTESSNWYVDEMYFHSDWNWIMEVWEKIKLIPNFEDWYDDLKLGSMRNMICGTFSIVDPKEAVVQSIWEFLNWYNEQKQ
jgi:hypothetical protein